MDAGQDKSKSRTTMFYHLLNPDATKGHVTPSVDELKDEAYIIIAAAADTTGNAMTIASYNIISNEAIYRKLASELREAFPDPHASLDFVLLERLPYLVRLLQASMSSLF